MSVPTAKSNAILIVLCVLVATTAQAQWTIVKLKPAGSDLTTIRATTGTQFIGSISVTGWQHGALWYGSTATSPIDLNPPDALFSAAVALDGTQQVGYVTLDDPQHAGPTHAALWTGTAISWVDLNPLTVAWGSTAIAVGGGQQVGTVAFEIIGQPGVLGHAGLWTGTAASWVDLHPTGAFYSWATGVDSGQQVGVVKMTSTGEEHASLWTGTAESLVDLNPIGSEWSRAVGVNSGQQVGYSDVNGFQHAAMWNGTAASWVDLSPKGFPDLESEASAVHGGQQVGYVTVATNDLGNTTTHAFLWSGTRAAWVDLHSLLPAGYDASGAFSIAHYGGYTYVVGAANGEPIMWISRGPCDWSGVLAPIKTDGSSIFKLGSTVPVKFQLTGDCASYATLEARLYAEKVSDTIEGTELQNESVMGVDAGNLFRFSNGQYVYNLGTKSLTAGTWRLRIDFADGVYRTVEISLR